MKARVKATGEIVEVKECASYYKERGWYFVSIVTGLLYKYEELVFDVSNKEEWYNKGWQEGWDEAVKSEIPKINPKLKGADPDYWTRLEHQYAGMAMQGILTNLGNTISPDYIVEEAEAYAHALVEKMKEERK